MNERKMMLICCLCGTTIETPRGYGADPVAQGRCCKACHDNQVQPARARERRQAERHEEDLRRYRAAMDKKDEAQARAQREQQWDAMWSKPFNFSREQR
jgi:hypothetical protein